MNILITAPNLDVRKNVSGISSVVNTIITNDTDHNYTHFIAGREDNEGGIGNRLIRLARGYYDLYKTLVQKKITLVHLNLAMNTKSLFRDYIVFLISYLLNKKIVVHLHGGKFILNSPSSFVLKYIINFIFSNAQHIICLSGLEKNIVEKEYNVTNVKVLENTVDNSYLRILHKEKNIKKLNVLFLGRLHESKGLRYILDTIDELQANAVTELHFTFCGAGPLEKEVKDIVAKYPEFVEFAGTVGGEIKNEILQYADIFLLPSIYGEGLPMALVEAMACGLVPIVTNDGSMGTFIDDDVTGIVVDKCDAPQISRALEGLLNSPEKMARLSKNAKDKIQKNYSIKDYVSSLNDIYTKSAA